MRNGARQTRAVSGNVMTTFNQKKIEARQKDAMGRIRSDVKILDCTIRDGGAVNNSHFGMETVRAVYDACADAGIDYMEVGYKNSRGAFSPSDFGDWRFCDDETVKRLVGDNKRDVQLAVMMDAGKSDCRASLRKKSDSPIDMIRASAYAGGLSEALDTVKYAADLGYETSVCIMAISTLSEREINKAFEAAAQSDADVVYLMDSFGGLDGHRLRYLLAKCIYVCSDAGKRVGVHIHNNLQLAFANTIDAVITGADIVDCSIAGLGRGAGNCRTELMVGFLRNPRFKLRPVLECAQNAIEPLRRSFDWGFDYPYMATGLLNIHPSHAINYKKSENRGSVADFYESLSED